LYFRKADFGYVMQKEGSIISYKYTPPRLEVAWPLYVERTWEQLYVQDQPERRVTDNYLRIVRVEAKEPLTVPAGAFDTFKIVVRNKWTNALVRQYWIAPEVKNLVRWEESSDSGVERRELTAFKVD